ncbi:MAG: hypothetical protein WC346_17705 [Methanogenium sp.]|jgi:hypothetical protein
MATVKEKGVTKNSRGTYEVRLKGVYYGSRKTLKEANDLSLSMQMAKTPAKKQSMVTGYHYDEPVLIPAPKAAEVVKRLDEQPEKKSFWQFLKDMFK